MTTVYELEKQATPGPHDVVKTPGWHGECQAAYIRDARHHTVARVQTVAEAQHLTHCRNHFMEALEALKRAEGWIADVQGEEDMNAPQWVKEVIKKMETIE